VDCTAQQQASDRECGICGDSRLSLVPLAEEVSRLDVGRPSAVSAARRKTSPATDEAVDEGLFSRLVEAAAGALRDDSPAGTPPLTMSVDLRLP